MKSPFSESLIAKLMASESEAMLAMSVIVNISCDDDSRDLFLSDLVIHMMHLARSDARLRTVARYQVNTILNELPGRWSVVHARLMELGIHEDYWPDDIELRNAFATRMEMNYSIHPRRRVL